MFHSAAKRQLTTPKSLRYPPTLPYHESQFPSLRKPFEYRKSVTQYGITVVPPRRYWADIQRIRKLRDRNYHRFYMPHISFGTYFPSLFQDESIDELKHRVRHALRETEDSGHSEVKMGTDPKLFSFRGEGKRVMHLREQDYQEDDVTGNMTCLQTFSDNLRRVFPETEWPPSIPHLTLGQWDSIKSAQYDADIFAKSLPEMRWPLKYFVFILRRRFAPIHDHERLYYPESVSITRCIPYDEGRYSVSEKDEWDNLPHFAARNTTSLYR